MEKKCVPFVSLAGEITAKLYVPGPAMAAPRSSETVWSTSAGPMRPRDAASAAGFAANVRLVSDQVLLETAWTSPPDPFAYDSGRVCMNRIAFLTLPLIGGTWNLRYASWSAASTARSVTSANTFVGSLGATVTSSSTGTVIDCAGVPVAS
ncbi:hypothetical protein D3C83_23180 [compost metagenome]